MHSHSDHNHDGSFDFRDSGLFLSELDKNSSSGTGGSTPPSSTNSSDWALLVFVKALFVGIPGLFLVLLFNGVLPMNEFTVILALFSLVTIVRTLTL